MAQSPKPKRTTLATPKPASTLSVASAGPGPSPLPLAFGILTALSVAAYPEAGRWIAFACAVALAAFDGARRLYRTREITIDLLDALLGGLIVYGTLSIAWSANPNGGIQTAIIATACLLLAAYLKRCATPELMTAIAAGAGVGAIGAIATNLWLPANQWAGFGNSGYAAEALILCLPFLWILWRDQSRFAVIGRLLVAPIAMAVVIYIAVFTPSVIGAFVIAVLAAIASITWAFRRGRSWGWLCVLAWLVVPSLVAWIGWDRLHLTERVLVRVELWLNAGFMILERPLFGHGSGSFIEVYPLFKEAHGDLMPFVNTQFESYVTEAEALHNDPLQLWTELGLAGLVPLLVFLASSLSVAAKRFSRDAYTQAAGVALVTVLAESLLEYPFQRAATLFLAVVALGFATRGAAEDLRHWRLRLQMPIAAGVAAIAVLAGIVFVVASYFQFAAERQYNQARNPHVDPVAAFDLAYGAHALDPLHRRIRTALPVLLDSVIRVRGLAAVPRALIDKVYSDVDNGGHFNTADLVARAQLLLQMSGGKDPAFPQTLADLKRGSARVAAAHAIEARYLIVKGQLAEALATIAEGEKYTVGHSSEPAADEAIRVNLVNLQRIAEARLHEQPSPEPPGTKP